MMELKDRNKSMKDELFRLSQRYSRRMSMVRKSCSGHSEQPCRGSDGRMKTKRRFLPSLSPYMQKRFSLRPAISMYPSCWFHPDIISPSPPLLLLLLPLLLRATSLQPPSMPICVTPLP